MVDTDGSLPQLVEDAFSFLEDQGFRVASRTPSSVHYENDEVGTFVLVFYDTNDKYLGFRVGPQAEPRDALTAAELDAIAGHAGGGGGLFPDHPSDMREAVGELAGRLEQHGQRALLGDESIFDQARHLRAHHTQQYTRKPK